MSVEELAELLIKQLGYDNNEKFDERVVLAMADTCRAVLLEDMISRGSSITGEYSRRFIQPLKFDTLHELDYVDLPCQVSSIKDYGAFRFVGPKDEETNYIPLRPAQVANIANTDISGLGGRSAYILEGSKVYFHYLPIAKPGHILMKLVPSMVWLFENSEDESAGTDDLIQKVVDMTMQRFQERRGTPVDKVNDNNPRP